MGYTFVFKRTEKKYLLSQEAYLYLKKSIGGYLLPDKYGKSTLCSIYLDTPDYRLIRASTEAVNYKEKIRLRSYGTPLLADDRVFLEIKKKCDRIVYKRRESMTLREAETYLAGGEIPFDSQIMKELHYAMNFYHWPKPAVAISYEREAFFDRSNPDLRLTFDTGVRFRTDRLSLADGTGGQMILPEETVLLEVKSTGGMPLWLAETLDSGGIYPTSFSKYGTAYQNMIKNKIHDFKRVTESLFVHTA